MTGPRFVTHATYKRASGYRISTVGVYDRLNGFAEVDVFTAANAHCAERLAAKLKGTQ